MDHIINLAKKYKAMAPTSVEVATILLPRLSEILGRELPQNQLTIKGTSIYTNVASSEKFIITSHKEELLELLKKSGFFFNFIS